GRRCSGWAGPRASKLVPSPCGHAFLVGLTGREISGTPRAAEHDGSRSSSRVSTGRIVTRRRPVWTFRRATAWHQAVWGEVSPRFAAPGRLPFDLKGRRGLISPPTPGSHPETRIGPGQIPSPWGSWPVDSDRAR